MFKILSVLTLLSLLVFVFVVFPIHESDRKAFKELRKSALNTDTKEFAQERTGISKQIWYQSNSPIYVHILSDHSKLCFSKTEKAFEVIEHFGPLSCQIVEKQQIRYLEAEKADYNYNTGILVADDTELWKYAQEGEAPSMHAMAKMIELTFKDEKIDFIAHQMSAQIQDKAL